MRWASNQTCCRNGCALDVETQYPVLLESKISAEHNGEVLGSEGVMDQFQWDVELDPSLFEPNIPPDYVDMRTL